ncbi:MAG: hypothetical protein KatS3mg111_1813 [Pirellulaceae bacterium]|nr:MAG: hypothetical protein KatS3mg111_1813 [Pirellulaceae bacterium]
MVKCARSGVGQGIAVYRIRRRQPGGRLVRSLAIVFALAMLPFTRANAQESSSGEREALAMYADAASFQNNRAFELAIEEWNKFLVKYPSSDLASKARYYLGVCYIQVNPPKIDDAIASFEQALADQQLELRPQALINLGWCLYTRAREAEPESSPQRRDLEKARKVLESYLQEADSPRYLDQALFYLGEVCSLAGDAAQAARYYRQMLEKDATADSPLRPDAWYALAMAEEELEDYAAAEQSCRRFLEEHPTHALAGEVRVRLADLFIRQERYADAVELLQSVVRDASMKAIADYALLRLGYALHRLDRQQQALEHLVAIAKDHPQSPHLRPSRLLAGQVYFQQQRFSEAIEQLSPLIDGRDELAATAAHLLAQAYLRNGNPQSAVEVADQVLRWLPAAQHALLKLDRAEALYAQPQRREAAYQAYVEVAEQAEDPQLAARAMYNAAFTALQLERFSEAQQWCERFLARFADDPLRTDVAYVAAEALLLQGRHDAAIEAYRALLRSAPTDAASSLWVLRLGTALYLSERYAEAIELLQAHLDRLPAAAQRAEAKYLMGACRLYQQHPGEAAELLEQSLEESNSWDAAQDAMLLLAEAYQQSGDRTQAKTTLEHFVIAYPRSSHLPIAKYRLAQLLAQAGEHDRAIEIYKELLDHSAATNLHRFARYGIAWSFMQQERFEAALPHLQRILNDPVSDSIADEALLAEGVALRKLGRLEEAAERLQRLTAATPRGKSTLAAAWHELGLTRTEQQQLDAAIAALQQCLSVSPDYQGREDVLYELAWNLHDAGKSEQAGERFRQLLAEFPDSEHAADAYFMVGQLAYQAAEYAAAAEAYRRATELARRDDLAEQSWYKLGWSLFEQEKTEEAQEAFATQLDRFPSGALVVDGWFMFGQCARQLGRLQAAMDAYTNAADLMAQGASPLAPGTGTLVYLHAAQVARELKDYQQAEQWLKKIENSSQDSPHRDAILFEIAWLKQLRGDDEAALELFEQVAETYRNPIGARARFMMGEIYFAQKQFDKAIPQFQRVMFGYGGEAAPAEIRTWQAQSAIEAARCSETLAGQLSGANKQKLLNAAREFYRYVVEKHPQHASAKVAQSRLAQLQQLR